jgi:hypothetical protein
MKKIIYFSLIITLVTSCKKKEDTTSTPDAVTGSIAGKVIQYDNSGEKLVSGLNNVTVSLDNDPNTAQTDAAGNYTINGVKQGIYAISFKKTGCTTFQNQQVTFPGNGTLFSNAYIVADPGFTFESVNAAIVDSISSDYQKVIRINVNISPQPKTVMGAIYFGYEADISQINYSYYVSFNIAENTAQISFNITVPFQDNPGNSLYLKIYPYSGITYSYFDFKSNTSVYTGYGTPLASIKVL